MSPTDEPPDTADEPEKGEHEHLDVDPARVAMWGGILLAGTAVAAVLAAFGYAAVRGIGVPDVFERSVDRVERPLPPQPRLEEDPSVTRREIQSRAREQLNTWEWVRRDEDVARIPVDRAMKIVVDAYQKESPPPAFLGSPDAGSSGGGPDAGITPPDAGPTGGPDAGSETME